MNLLAFLSALEALGQLLPAIGQFVNLVHPAQGQEAAKVQTALAVANAGLAVAGVTAETIASFTPAISAAIAPSLASASVVLSAQTIGAQTLASITNTYPNVVTPPLPETSTSVPVPAILTPQAAA